MKIKQASYYYLRSFLRAGLIYFGIILALNIPVMILNRVLSGATANSQTVIGATFIFLFVLGLNAYRRELKLYIQNGVSRMTMLVSFGICAVASATAATALDTLIAFFFDSGTSSLYDTLYRASRLYGNAAVQFLWNALLNLAFLCVGFTLAALFYRMGKALKIVVLMGAPVLLLVVFPILEATIPGFQFYQPLWRFLRWCLGLDGLVSTFPLRAAGSFAVFTAALAGCSYLLTRRVTCKDA